MNGVINMRTLVKKMVYRLISFIALFIKVDEELILLESNPVYQDNTGALFRHMMSCGLNKKYKILWFDYNAFDFPLIENVKVLTFKNRNIFNRIINNILVQYYGMKAGFYFYSHRYMFKFIPKSNQRIVNLTHGVPIKDITGKQPSQDYVTDILSLSKFSDSLRQKTVSVPESIIRFLGYPRNDLLKSNHSKIVKDYNIVWLPTYRTHKKFGDTDTFPLNPTTKDFVSLNQFLGNNNMKLYIKPHPAQQFAVQTTGYDHIIFIDDRWLHDRKMHLYELLSSSSLLVTDYSSVYVDYLLTNKPILFTFDDIENYKKDWGFTVDDIYAYTPGEKIYNINDLKRELYKILILKRDSYIDQRLKLKEVFHDHIDFNASHRILEYFNLGL